MRVDGISQNMPLSPVGESTLATVPSPATAGASAPSFESVIGKVVGEANVLSAQADQKAQALAAGASDDLHGTMIASKEAEISVKLVGSIRNKLLDAFHEIWRTSV